MMKQVRFKMPLRALALTAGLALSATVFAQSGKVTGNVKDATGEPIMGATITANGKTVGITDLDGNYSIDVPAGTELTITYIGMTPQTFKAGEGASITLQDDSKALNEVVVIGYGAVKKSDLTGSVMQLKPDGKNKGLVVNAQDMLEGKVAGVNVVSDGGTPGGAATIRIRGGSSLNASNDPLIVIDGIAMDNSGVKGSPNILSTINPQDIESFNVLKDASATAIYGSRGSNGVIIITTKKGHRGTQVSYSGSMNVSYNNHKFDVLDADEYRALITSKFGEDSEAYRAMGNANTNWQDEIYRTAIGQDHNVSVGGSIGALLPYRVSFGYTSNQGIVNTSKFDRATASVNLSPSLFDNHLNIQFNAKGMWSKNRYADGSAIGSSVQFDPTQPIYDNSVETDFPNFDPKGNRLYDRGPIFYDHNNYGGYTQWRQTGSSLKDDSYPTSWNDLAPRNPLSVLNLKNDRAISRDLITSLDVDYKIHGFEDLRLHGTVGLDLAKGKQTTDVDPMSPLAFYYGSNGFDQITKRNLQGSAYIQYYHDFNDKYTNHFDIMAGTEESHFWSSEKSRYFAYYRSTNKENPGKVYTDSGKDYGNGVGPYLYKTEHYIVSFFGRANWSMMDGRYMVTATVREDGSSRFKDHWALFPSAAFAWRIKDENLFKDINWLSNWKIRLSYGQTGQQEGIGDYNWFDIYQSNSGTNNYYPILDANGGTARPSAVNKDLTWETTITYNVGTDFGFFNNRLNGSLDWYYRKTTDLLNTVYVPAGSNFRNQVSSNIGDLSNTGVEFQLNWVAIDKKDWNWTLGYNFTYNYNKITDLNGGGDTSYVVADGGSGISSGTGLTARAWSVGHSASAFYVYQQVYDKDGKPIEGAVVDRNGDGQITGADRYFYKQSMAPVTMGLSSRLEYKNWDFGFNMRASLGNYVYADMFANQENMSQAGLWAPSKFLHNVPSAVVALDWQGTDERAVLSDYWIRNASFLKMDNITLGYSFENLFRGGGFKGIGGRIYGSVNNVFTITNYDGVDPEVSEAYHGVDKNLYPRPISFILGLNLNF